MTAPRYDRSSETLVGGGSAANYLHILGVWTNALFDHDTPQVKGLCLEVVALEE